MRVRLWRFKSEVLVQSALLPMTEVGLVEVSDDRRANNKKQTRHPVIIAEQFRVNPVC